MQYHDHVTSHWPRCSTVRLQGDYLVYALDWQRRYDLADKRPQLQVRFLNLKTDEDLMGFMRVWGPLWQENPDRGEREISVPRSYYWAFQKGLKAALRLARNARFDDAAGLKTAILEYLAADDESHQQSPIGKPGEAGSTAFFLSLLYSRYTGIDVSRPEDVPHPKEWIPKAPLSLLRNVAVDCLVASFIFMLHASWKDGRLNYSWKPAEFSSLGQAIEMELWNDLTGVRAVTICDECQTVFLPESAHLRKFCSHRCAHRVAMRMWRKNNTEGQHKRKRGKHAKAKKA